MGTNANMTALAAMTLRAVKAELRQRMHAPIPTQGQWLSAVVGGDIR